jgi:biopolymer transport protein ExbB
MMGANPRNAVVRAGVYVLLMLAVWAGFAIGITHQSSYGAEGAEAAAPAEAAPADAAPAEGGAAAPAEPKQTKSYFMYVVESSGFIGLVILCLSIYFVAQVARMFFELREQIVMPPETLAECERLIQEQNVRGVYEFVQGDDCFISRVLTTGITELPNGLAHARDSMERVGEAETVDMEKKISMMAVLGTLGPMIGLLGTLKGMIASFSVIAMSDVQLKASQVAGGISEALMLTFEGVALSVPSIYFYSLFRNRVSHLSVNTMLKADQILRHIAQMGRQSKQAGAPVAAGRPLP